MSVDSEPRYPEPRPVGSVLRNSAGGAAGQRTELKWTLDLFEAA